MPGWLPLCANLIASFWSFYSSIIQSDFKSTLFAVMVISSRIVTNFCRSWDVVLVIHVFPDFISSRSLHSTGFSAVHFAVDGIPSWFIM